MKNQKNQSPEWDSHPQPIGDYRATAKQQTPNSARLWP